MKTEISTITVDSPEPAQCRWLVVSQVKSYRVVYFTDDPEYVPPMHGDWYYVSPHEGDLPKGMTLRNCWRWRFDGHAFVDASEPKPKSQEAALLNSNKEALHKLLRQKIDALRKPFAPSSLMGEQIRQAKLAEAKAMMQEETAAPLLGYLLAAAAANASTLHNMARRIVQQDELQQAMLIETERLRENLAFAISSATTQIELIALRERLMSELAPGLIASIQPKHTTPSQHGVEPSAPELLQEKIRLRIQLREKINDLRRPYLSQYLLDDVVLKHKGQIARAVISSGGDVPAGLDAIVLISHAAARGQTLLAAANDVLTEMDEIAGVLMDTEQMKDALLSKISLLKLFAEIEQISKVICNLKVAPAAEHIPPIAEPDRSEKNIAPIRAAIVKQSHSRASIEVIKRVKNPDQQSFVALAKKGYPFLIEGVVDRWSLYKLTMQALESEFGSLKVRARVDNYIETAFSAQRQERTMSLRQYFELVTQIQGDLPPYLGNQALPELTALCDWSACFSGWAAPKMWIGPGGTVTPLHCDYDDNLFAQVRGSKRFTLYAPHHAEQLHTRKVNTVLYASKFDPERPDTSRFPEAAQLKALKCTVRAGEMLYLPAGWFHHVRAMDFSLSVNRWARDKPFALVQP